MAQSLYLVTGVMGHLGNTVAKTLIERGCRVRGLALDGDDSVSFDSPNFELVYADVCDKNSLAGFFANSEGYRLIVIHTAGLITIGSRFDERVRRVNVGGTANIIELCIKNNVARLVYISSVHAIPELPHGQTMHEIKRFNPDLVRGCYAKTKAEATQLVLDSAKRGLNVCVVHPSGLVGPLDYHSGHLTKLITDYMSGGLTAAVEGGYDMVDSRDVAAAVVRCADFGKSGSCYICSGKYVTIRDFLGLIHEITGRKAIKTYLPLWFAKLTAPLAEAYYRLLRQTPLYTSYSLYTLTSNSKFCNKKAREELGFSPRPLADTVRDTLDWLKKQNRIRY